MTGTYKKAGQDSGKEVYDILTLGEGVKLKGKREITFTKKEALRILEEVEEFPGDRSLKQSHVDELVKAMIRETFQWPLVDIITCTCDGKLYRMNGQHTAWARLELDESYDSVAKVTLLEYEAKTIEDVRILYSSIDRGSPRTKNNVIHSYLAGKPEFQEIKGRVMAAIPSGFALWFWPTKNERRQYDGDEIALLLQTQFLDLTLTVGKFLGKFNHKDCKHIYRGPVIAAMFATFQKAPQIAAKFWEPIGDGVGFDNRNDPRLKLRTFLMEVSVGMGAGALSDKKKVSQEYMLRCCLVAWRAHRENRTLQLLKATEKGKRPSVK